ncbi:hypothetical protein GCM10009127_16950 [Alteraurantiacibacter aestuarii]|uniref:TraB/GumN family protein n=2 Tax=Alteraurantiacibacter aestuarii TaxID=650004 RepID=A0A844ZQ22_9SPHN|nr:DUF5694 domain-containing protein [Alteraurantiacibacter aestuarii]MXO87719.1 hypothetical protein [Alteraurantiacibacter aestuarii]
MIARLCALLLAMGTMTASHATATAQDQTAPEPQVMLLGTYHLASSNRDLINLPVEDVLVPERQQEIERLVDGLARWQPTRVAIEWERSDQAGLDRRYADYLAGDLDVSANERDQIAFRLARKLGFTKIYALDWNGQAPGDPAEYDFIDWAERNGQSDRFDAFVTNGQAQADQTASAMSAQTVGEWYYDLNGPAARLRQHEPYFEMAAIGSNDDNPGAAWVGTWYARNLRIFNNLRETLGPGERVFVLYGAGHVYLLEQFLRESGAAASVDPRPYIQRQ